MMSLVSFPFCPVFLFSPRKGGAKFRRALLFSALGCAYVLPTRLAGAGLIIDDFNDPATLESMEGPESVFTDGVGDLSATREISFRQIGGGQEIAEADVSLTVPGQYRVDVEDGGSILFVEAKYSFEPTDLTQGGLNDAFLVEFTLAEGVITTFPSGYRAQPPAVRLLAYPSSGRSLLLAEFTNVLTVPFPRHQTPYTMVVPFERFTDRGGGTINGDFTGIYGFELWLSAAGANGPWQVDIDSIRVGSTTEVPESDGFVIGLILLMCIFAVTLWHRSFSKLGFSERRSHDDVQKGIGMGRDCCLPVDAGRS
jgi:hypothetical protein